MFPSEFKGGKTALIVLIWGFLQLHDHQMRPHYWLVTWIIRGSSCKWLGLKPLGGSITSCELLESCSFKERVQENVSQYNAPPSEVFLYVSSWLQRLSLSWGGCLLVGKTLFPINKLMKENKAPPKLIMDFWRDEGFSFRSGCNPP